MVSEGVPEWAGPGLGGCGLCIHCKVLAAVERGTKITPQLLSCISFSLQVRELFVMAREHAPSIIFMDEIDSIGSSRLGGGSGGEHITPHTSLTHHSLTHTLTHSPPPPPGDSEVQRTMLELLNQLDGFEATQNIKVVMATNRIDILDSALLRPGRIDRKIEFPPPNEDVRPVHLLQLYNILFIYYNIIIIYMIAH